jgi:hypothetical protein
MIFTKGWVTVWGPYRRGRRPPSPRRCNSQPCTKRPRIPRPPDRHRCTHSTPRVCRSSRRRCTRSHHPRRARTQPLNRGPSRKPVLHFSEAILVYSGPSSAVLHVTSSANGARRQRVAGGGSSSQFDHLPVRGSRRHRELSFGSATRSCAHPWTSTAAISYAGLAVVSARGIALTRLKCLPRDYNVLSARPG